MPRASLSLRWGQRALNNGDVEGARIFFQDAVDAQPKWAVARLWLGTAMSENGELELAKSELDRAATLSPQDVVVPLWKGRTLIDHQRYDEAQEVLEAAFSSSKASRNLHVTGYLSLARWAAEGTDEVLEELGWEISPGGGQLWGRWLLELEQRFPGGPGTDFFPTTIESPGSVFDRISRWRAGRRVDRAQSKLDGGSYIDALDQLEAAEMLWSEAPEIPELRIKGHLGAVAAREKELEADPNDVELRLEAAEDYLELGVPRDALRVLTPVEELISSLDPKRLSWRAGYALVQGRALLALDDWSPAIEAFSAARELWPLELEPSYYLAIALLRAGCRHEGRRALISACHMEGKLVQLRLQEYREAT